MIESFNQLLLIPLNSLFKINSDFMFARVYGCLTEILTLLGKLHPGSFLKHVLNGIFNDLQLLLKIVNLHLERIVPFFHGR